MTFGQKRSQLSTAHGPKRKKPAKQKNGDTGDAAITPIDQDNVFHPAPHLAPDVQFVSGDKKPMGFALHTFLLRLRSPVLAAMLEGLEVGSGASDPLELQESAPDLRLLFRAMYSNDPQTIMTAGNVIRLCGLAHKYAATELENVSFELARKLVKVAKLTGTSPTIPELLLLGQEVKNPAILDAILAKSVRSFGAEPVATITCSLHPQGCPGSPQRRDDALDACGRALLVKLNPSTLVRLIEKLHVEKAKTKTKANAAPSVLTSSTS